MNDPVRPRGVGRHAVKPGILVLVLIIAGCSGAGKTGGTPKTATGSALSPSASVGPPAGIASTLPSPLPSPGSDLTLPAYPLFASFQGIADSRGSGTFDLNIGRSGPGSPYFAPTVIEGTSGQVLHLHIANSTPALHNFTIREERVDIDIASAGAVDTIVVFPKSGALVFFCRYHGEADGHAGELFTVPS